MRSLTTLTSTIGSMLAGPPGAAAGGLIGSVVEHLGVNLGSDDVQALYRHMRQYWTAHSAANHDLCHAFRAALILALHDIGGRTTFREMYQPPRLPLSDGLCYDFTAHGPDTAARLQHALRELARAFGEKRLLLPGDAASSSSGPAEGVLFQDTLDAATPLLAAIIAFLCDEFADLMAEVPALIAHLETHLFNRTLLLFAELLKDPEHTRAWRAFQRDLLETLRDQLQAVATDGCEVRESMQALQNTLTGVLAQIDDDYSPWTHVLHDLPTSLARIAQQQQEGFCARLQRALAQDATLQQHMDALRERRNHVLFIVTETQASMTYTETVATEILEEAATEILEKVRVLFPRLSAPAYRVEGATLLVERRLPRVGLHERQRHLLERHTLFGGRDRELAQIQTFLETQPGGYLFVTGPSGYGKSALLANLIAADRTRYCWYILNALEGTHRRVDFLRQVCEQLLTYYQMPPQHDDDLPRDPERLEALYAHLLRMPLVRPDRPLILVIDGLDEAEERFILSDRYLPRDLPPGKFIIVAARSMDESYLPRLGLPPDRVQMLELTTLDTAGIADLLLKAGGTAAIWATDPRRLTDIQHVSQGDPFYLHYLVEDICNGRIGRDDLARQPVGLHAYLDGWWRQIVASAFDQAMHDLLGTLMVAHGPLSRADLLTLWPGLEESFDLVLDAVRRFVVQHEAPPGDAPASITYALCHPRFQAYLVTHKLPGQVAHYRDRLRAYCARWPEHQSRYALRHYPAHLLELRAYAALYALAQDATFGTAQREAFPTEPDVPLQTIQAALRGALAAEDEDASMIATLLLYRARQMDELQQEHPLDLLRAGSLARALNLADLSDPQRRVLWYLLLAWELYDTGRADAAAELITTFETSGVPRLTEWQADIAATLLTHLLRYMPTAVVPLIRQLVGGADALTTIATAQAQAGQYDQARQTAAAINLGSDRAKALAAIAEIQAEAGLYTDARQTADTIERGWNRLRALQAIATAQAQAGLYADACQTAVAIDDERKRAVVLRVLATAQARAGLYGQARQTVAAIEPEWERAAALAVIAEALARSRFSAEAQATFAEARQIVAAIEPEWRRAAALAVIAEALARSGFSAEARATFAEAHQTTAAITVEWQQAAALRVLAQAQVEVRLYTEARQTAAAIKPKWERAAALRELAAAQVRAGLVKEARATMTDARQTAAAIADTWEQAAALQELAKTQAQVELYEDAYRTATAITDEWWRVVALRELATVQARAGLVKEALATFTTAGQTATAIEPEWRRAVALQALAAVQADAGFSAEARTTLATACQTAVPSDNERKRAAALRAIADVQAQAGLYTEARQTTAAIADADYRAGALRAIAVAQAKAGFSAEAWATFAEARQTAAVIANEWERTEAMAAIAAAQAEAGFRLEAQATFAAARQITAAIAVEWQRAWVLRMIAAAQVEAGLYAEAHQSAAAIDDEKKRAVALRELAEAQARAGLYGAARQTATAIEYEWEQATALAAIVEAQARIGLYGAARQTAAAIADERWRAAALAAIAEAQAQAGLVVDAQATFADAHQVAVVADERDRAALRTIAAAQARAGLYVEARQTATSIAVEKYRAEALAAIATAQAQAGHFAEARQTAAAVAVEKYRAEALAAIATAQAQAGHFAEARQTAAAIAVEKYRAEALAAIATAQARTEQFAEAVQTAAVLADEEKRAEVLAAIAEAQNRAGLGAEAQATLAEARQTAAAIADEWKQAVALATIAEAQAHAGFSAEAVQTAATILTKREQHLPTLAAAFLDVGDRDGFKQLLLLGVIDLTTAYAMCGVLARAYPAQAAAVAQVVRTQR